MEYIETQQDDLLQEIKTKLLTIKEYTEIGVPIKKLRSDTNEIKRKLLLKWIREQRDLNLSYQQIEDKLNGARVPTLSGKDKWDKGFICQIEKGK